MVEKFWDGGSSLGEEVEGGRRHQLRQRKSVCLCVCVCVPLLYIYRFSIYSIAVRSGEIVL